ncbi:hypothetical protein AB0A94_30555 [Streptomyces sp. NPDC044984]|uniref:hypothetical protein n=1 Tax=Streptomyces sp. NPDC044984 TaxID=3154335 RepID=UPI00340B8D91
MSPTTPCFEAVWAAPAALPRGEGLGRPGGPAAYPHGAHAFHELLRRWREESMDEVLA